MPKTETVRKINVKGNKGQKTAVSPKDVAAKAAKAPTGLYFFPTPPSGKYVLRAYFVALMIAQIGKLVADKPFKLWSGNFRTHLENGRLIHQGEKRYVLTTAGVNYLNEPQQAAQPDLLEQMLASVTRGETAKCYGNYKPVAAPTEAVK